MTQDAKSPAETPAKLIAARAIASLDLTNLNDDCDSGAVRDLAARGQTAHGPVAALCVWPRFAAEAKRLLAGSGI